MLLEGKTAIITGGTAGIGFAVAERFLGEGCDVALFGTNEQRGTDAVASLEKQFPDRRILFFAIDVSDAARVEEGVKKVLEAFGEIAILVNNAGVTRDQLLLRMSESDWDQVLSTNLKSAFLVCRAVAKKMMKAKQGRMIQMSSVVGEKGNKGQANYAASKAGMIGMTKALAKELAHWNILVNAIAPGFIETAMTQALPEKKREEILQGVGLGRLGESREVADVALFLASDLSSYVTGQVITVDGGLVL